MRADNSRHIIAAARRRAEQARQRAITALRRMDATGQPVTFDAVAASASPAPGSMPRPTCARRSRPSGNDSGKRRHPRPSPVSSAPLTRP